MERATIIRFGDDEGKMGTADDKEVHDDFGETA